MFARVPMTYSEDSEKSGKDLTAFFDQYLRTTLIPKLEYEIKGGSITYRYVDIIEDFDMPIRVFVDGSEKWLFPTAEWKTEQLDGTQLDFDKNFYIEIQKI